MPCGLLVFPSASWSHLSGGRSGGDGDTEGVVSEPGRRGLWKAGWSQAGCFPRPHAAGPHAAGPHAADWLCLGVRAGLSLCTDDLLLRPGLCGVGGTFGGGCRLRPFAHHWPLVALTLTGFPVCALRSVPWSSPPPGPASFPFVTAAALTCPRHFHTVTKASLKNKDLLLFCCSLARRENASLPGFKRCGFCLEPPSARVSLATRPRPQASASQPASTSWHSFFVVCDLCPHSLTFSLSWGALCSPVW